MTRAPERWKEAADNRHHHGAGHGVEQDADVYGDLADAREFGCQQPQRARGSDRDARPTAAPMNASTPASVSNCAATEARDPPSE